jgi:hypothetical protein
MERLPDPVGERLDALDMKVAELERRLDMPRATKD